MLPEEEYTPTEEVLFNPFPKQTEFIETALSGEFNLVVYGGAIRGGKTFALLALFIILCRIFPGSRWAIVRKDLPVIKSNLYPSWNKIKPTNFIKTDATDYNQNTTTFTNGSQIIFFPESYSTDKEQDRWKGLEVNGFGFEEINECKQQSLSKAFERAGSYIIKGAKVQPKPLIVATCNPTQGWFKELVYTPWKNGTLKPTWQYIQSRIYDNTPLLEQQPNYLPSLKANLSHYEFAVFVEGDWDVQLKTGNEYLNDFDPGKHVKSTTYTPHIPVCISIDSNVHPYIAVTCWQLISIGPGWLIKQIEELPAADPENTASMAGKKTGAWLKSIGTTDKVLLYGDYSTKNSNNIDDNKRSFFKIVKENIEQCGFRTEDKLLPHVSVASIGEFINAIFKGEVPGLEIHIGEHCKKSIGDYMITKKDKVGAILKEIQPATKTVPAHQKNAHLTDTFKDMIAQAFKPEFDKWVSGRKKNGLQAAYFR